ncbi:hypothetical protein CPC08DRAFT_706449 [Agrocybe pediades]|nr:hypothetical protein CPC08DRAFT_706449 [Agrocybe pediades]
MPKTQQPPKIITLSTVGSTKTSREQASGVGLKVMYGYLIQSPIMDKLGMERIIYHCAGWDWNPEDGEPKDEVVGKGWRERPGLPAPGTLRDTAMVVRAALLTDGECLADKKGREAYRVNEGEVKEGYNVSRRDVGHFIFDAVVNTWGRYGGKQVSIAY